MFSKYAYNKLVEKYDRIVVVGVGSGAGKTTQILSLQASARAIGKRMAVPGYTVPDASEATLRKMARLFNRTNPEAIVLSMLPGSDERAAAEALGSILSIPIFCVTGVKSGLSSEYLELQQGFEDCKLELLRLLPDGHPRKVRLIELLDGMAGDATPPEDRSDGA